MVKSTIRSLLVGTLSIASNALARDRFQTVIQDQVDPGVGYRVSLSVPVNPESFEKLLILLEKNQLKPVRSAEAENSGFLPTVNTQASTDLMNLIKETLGENHQVNVVPLKSMLMSAQEEVRF